MGHSNLLEESETARILSPRKSYCKHFVSMIKYCKTYNISHGLVSNGIVDHSDVAHASPVDTASSTPSFST